MILLAEGMRLNACVLEKKKGTLQLVKKQQGLSGLEALPGFLEEDMPLALSISGRGILHKRIEPNAEPDAAKLLTQAIPNVKASDFYLQTVKGASHLFLSIARRTVVDDLLAQFETLHVPVVSLSFGGMALVSLAPFVQEKAIWNVGEHQLEFKKGELVLYAHGSTAALQTSLPLGSEEIEPEMAVAYANAFQQFLPALWEAQVPPVQERKEEYVQKQLFTKLGWGVLSFFLVVLLGNYFFFSQLSQNQQALSLAFQLQKNQLEELNQLKKEVGEKETFFTGEGWTHSPRASFFSDRIAATVPSSVLLTSLTFHPLDAVATRDKRKNVFEDGRIVLLGTCQRPIDLNGWIRRLKDFPWAKKVDVDNYSYDSNEKKGNFKVEIDY